MLVGLRTEAHCFRGGRCPAPIHDLCSARCTGPHSSIRTLHPHQHPCTTPTCLTSLCPPSPSCMTVYLALSIPSLEYALSHVTNNWISLCKARFSWLRWIPKRGKVSAPREPRFGAGAM